MSKNWHDYDYHSNTYRQGFQEAHQAAISSIQRQNQAWSDSQRGSSGGSITFKPAAPVPRKVTCFGCKGQRQVACAPCRGKGKQDSCASCTSTGRTICDSCRATRVVRSVAYRVWTFRHHRFWEASGLGGFDGGGTLPEEIWVPLSEKEFTTPEAKLAGLPANAAGEAAHAFAELNDRNKDWLSPPDGSLLFHESRGRMVPTVECNVEYDTNEGRKSLTLHAAGGEDAFAIHAAENPAEGLNTPARRIGKNIIRGLVAAQLLGSLYYLVILSFL